MLSEPPITRVEERELADIPPDARNVFYRTIRVRWYATATAGTLLGWSIEYTAFGLDYGWLYTLPLFAMAMVVHRMKWNRSTDYGALAKAKLAMDRDWPEWQRQRDHNEELAAIRDRNPARENGDWAKTPDRLARGWL